MMTSIELLQKLKEQHDKHSVSVLVGAGFSKNAIQEYPDWNELLRDLVMELYGQKIKEQYRQYKSGNGPFYYTEDSFKKRVIEAIIHDIGYLNLVSKYIEAKGYREAIDVYIEEHLPYVEETGGVFSVINMPEIPFNASNLDVHKELLLCKWKHVYTTNYDNLLELTNDHYGLDYKMVVADYKLSNLSEKRGIVKVHGSLVGDSLSSDYEFDNDKSRRYVISAEDYSTYSEKHQAFSYQMKTGLLTGEFCLIGFSGNDPNFLGWLEWMKDVLDRDTSDPKKQKTKVFLIIIGQQDVEKSRMLFYQNHHIGIIDILDDEVLKRIGYNPLAPKNVGNILTMLFRYLNDGTSVVVNHDCKVITNTMSQYQRIWSNIDVNNVSDTDVAEVRRLRNQIVMPTDTTYQRMAFDTLFKKKDWTRQDAELFALACDDCGMFIYSLRNEEKDKMLASVTDWKRQHQINLLLQHEEFEEVDDVDLKAYMEVMKSWYSLEPEKIKTVTERWEASGNWVLNKAAVTAVVNEGQSADMIDGFINTSPDIQRKYYASLLGNVITMTIPAKYSYNVYKTAGITGFIECKDAMIKKIRHQRNDVKPYGRSGKNFMLSKRLSDVDEALRFVHFLFRTGFPIQYKSYLLMDNQEWYDVFRRVYEYMPYPALYYSLQLTDKNILMRIGQDYAFSMQLQNMTSDLLKRILRAVLDDAEGINSSSCLWVAKELLCSVSDDVWFDDAVKILKKDIIPNVAMISSRTPLYGFLHSAAFHLKDPVKKSKLLNIALEHFDEDTFFCSYLIYQIQLKDSVVLSEEQKKEVENIFDSHPLNKTYLLAAHLGECGLLDNQMQQQLKERIVTHPEEIENASFEQLHSITYITNKDGEAMQIVKNSILKKDIWWCGVTEHSATPPNYLELNKICRDIEWTEDEMRVIMGNLQKNLNLMETGYAFGDTFFAFDHMGLLTNMMEFVEHDCIERLGLTEFEPVIGQIKGVMAKGLGDSNVFDKIFDNEAEVENELQFLARCIDYYGVEKYRVYVDAILDRALLQCKASLTMILAFVEFLVEKHFDEMRNDRDVYRLKLMLDKYVEVDYQKYSLILSSAYRCLRNVAKALKENGLADDDMTMRYWMEDEFVRRFS